MISTKFSDANICNGDQKGVPFPANFVPFQATVDYQIVTIGLFC